jgi:hypothetical protein
MCAYLTYTDGHWHCTMNNSVVILDCAVIIAFEIFLYVPDIIIFYAKNMS